MKRGIVYSVLLLMLLFCFPIKASASIEEERQWYQDMTASEDGNYVYNTSKDGNGVWIRYYTGEASAIIVIPDTIDGKKVIAIGEEDHSEDGNDERPVWFEENDIKKRKMIQKIVLPDTMVFVKRNAFKELSAMEEIILPENITKISEGAFIGCSSLKELILPKKLKTIEYEAFKGCSKMKEIRLPDKVRTVGHCAFYNCISLEKIFLSSSVKKIGVFTVTGCKNLEEIELDSKNLFYKKINGCILSKDGKTLVLGKREGKCQIPKGVQKIEKGAFAESKIKSVTCPSSLRWIAENAFGGAAQLKVFQCNPGLRQIDSFAFAETALEKFILPKKLEKLGCSVFHQSPVQKIKLAKNNKNFLMEGGLLYSKDKKTLYIITERKKTYVVSPKVKNIDTTCFNQWKENKIKKIIFKCSSFPESIDRYSYEAGCRYTGYGYMVNKHVKIYVPKKRVKAYKNKMHGYGIIQKGTEIFAYKK